MIGRDFGGGNVTNLGREILKNVALGVGARLAKAVGEKFVIEETFDFSGERLRGLEFQDGFRIS